MTIEERRELLDVFLAAVHAVVPSLTREQKTLVREVVEGMLREELRTKRSG